MEKNAEENSKQSAFYDRKSTSMKTDSRSVEQRINNKNSEKIINVERLERCVPSLVCKQGWIIKKIERKNQSDKTDDDSDHFIFSLPLLEFEQPTDCCVQQSHNHVNRIYIREIYICLVTR